MHILTVILDHQSKWQIILIVSKVLQIEHKQEEICSF